MAERTLRLKAVIAMTGLSRSMIYKLIDGQEFPPGFTVGACRLFRESDVLAWIQTRSEGKVVLFDGKKPSILDEKDLKELKELRQFREKMLEELEGGFPTEEEIDESIARIRREREEEMARDPNWMPFS